MNQVEIQSWPWRKQQMFHDVCQEILELDLPKWARFYKNISSSNGEISYSVRTPCGVAMTVTSLEQLQEVYNKYPNILPYNEWDSPNPSLEFRLHWPTLNWVKQVIDSHRTAVIQRMQETYTSPTKNRVLEDRIVAFLSECDKPYYDPQITDKSCPDWILWNTSSRITDEKKWTKRNFRLRWIIQKIVADVNASKLIALTENTEPQRLYNFLIWKFYAQGIYDYTKNIAILINNTETSKLCELLNGEKHDFIPNTEELVKYCNPQQLAEFINSLDDAGKINNYKPKASRWNLINLINTWHCIAKFCFENIGRWFMYGYEILELIDVEKLKRLYFSMHTEPQDIADYIKWLNWNQLERTWRDINNIENLAKLIGLLWYENIQRLLSNIDRDDFIKFINTAREEDINKLKNYKHLDKLWVYGHAWSTHKDLATIINPKLETA